MGRKKGFRRKKETRDKISQTLKGMTPKNFKDILKYQFREGNTLWKKRSPWWNNPNTKRSKENMSKARKKLFESPSFRKKHTENILKGLMKKPTSYEKKISELCIKHKLPFIYTGNGAFLIGHKNPDFINKKDRIAIEVYNDYFKERDFGSCEEYERQRKEYFSKYGYKTIFIRSKHIENKKWESICIQKINEAGG